MGKGISKNKTTGPVFPTARFNAYQDEVLRLDMKLGMTYPGQGQKQ